MSETTGTTETVTWSTATDWDNSAVDDYGVHENVTNTDHDDATIVKKGYPTESIYKSGSLSWFYPCHEDTGSTIYDFGPNNDDQPNDGGTINFDTTGVLDTTAIDIQGGYFDMDSVSRFGTGDWTHLVFFNPSRTGGDYRIGTHRVDIGYIPNVGRTGNAEFQYWDGSENVIAPITTGTWYMGTIVNDTTNSEVRGYLDGVRESTHGQININTNGRQSIAARNDGNLRYEGKMAYNILWKGEAFTDSEVAQLYDAIAGTSSVTTGTKSFSSNVTPDLQNLSYSLNGETITLDVIGSPTTASEEIVTQSLDGSTSYNLTWSNSHTDFRIRMDMGASSITGSTPTINTLELVG